MKCTKCNSTNLTVYDSRPSGSYKKRKRLCNDCGNKFVTCEYPIDSVIDKRKLDAKIKSLLLKVSKMQKQIESI